MASVSNLLQELKRLYYALDEGAKLADKEPFFRVTNKGSKALGELALPHDRNEFRALIWDLHIIFYEGSGHGKRIPENVDRGVIDRIKKLRNYYEHDIEHGNEKEVRKKIRKIGDIFHNYAGKEILTKEEDWKKVAIGLIEDLVALLRNLFPTLEKRMQRKKTDRRELEFSDNRITIFPSELVKFRRTGKHGMMHHLAASPIFLPTFSAWTPPPQFGNTRSAINITSHAYGGSFESFEKFVGEIERLWLEETRSRVRGISRFIPRSISMDGYMLYGAGVGNLLEATETCDLGMITMILQGVQGEDYAKTFFIIVSSYRKGSLFRDNFIDFYLCNIPVEWDWINQINDTLDTLSRHNEKAESYSLKPYHYFIWKGVQRMPIRNNILGGIGRNGYGDEREHDVFEGLIFGRNTIGVDFDLDTGMSWTMGHKKDIRCPVDCLDEFVITITNHLPTVNEIQTGELVGISPPHVYMLGFDGYGHDIFAVNGWGWSEFGSNLGASKRRKLL